MLIIFLYHDDTKWLIPYTPSYLLAEWLYVIFMMSMLYSTVYRHDYSDTQPHYNEGQISHSHLDVYISVMKEK